MVNFCPDCGTSTDGGSQRFCGMCGKSFLGDEPALPESDVPTSPTSSRYETGERDKLKKVRACACLCGGASLTPGAQKNKSWGKKTSYRTYFTEVSSSPITSRVKKFSKRGRDDKSSRTIEVKSDWFGSPPPLHSVREANHSLSPPFDRHQAAHGRLAALDAGRHLRLQANGTLRHTTISIARRRVYFTPRSHRNDCR